VVFVDFVLRCRMGEDCAVGSWLGPKNPFRPLINHTFEGELLGFEGDIVALKGGPSDGGIHPELAVPALLQATGWRRRHEAHSCDDEETARNFSSPSPPASTPLSATASAVLPPS
jgi:hypothetical protein